MVVRRPRQPGGGASIEKEARWLPVVAEHVAVAVPRSSPAGPTSNASDGLGRDLDGALRVWDQATNASETARTAPTWYRGDLLAENLLLKDDRLAAVLDFGSLSIGDPTVDLVVAWEALDGQERADFRRALDVDDATWVTSRGWALFIAMIMFPYHG